MAYSEWDYKEKIEKFTGKTKHECLKLVWQWCKEKNINLSLFEELIHFIYMEK